MSQLLVENGKEGVGLAPLAFTPGAIRLSSMLHIEDRSIDVLGDAALSDGTPKKVRMQPSLLTAAGASAKES